MDNPLVFREGGGVDEDVVHVAYDFTMVDELMKDVIHHFLEHCRQDISPMCKSPIWTGFDPLDVPRLLQVWNPAIRVLF